MDKIKNRRKNTQFKNLVAGFIASIFMLGYVQYNSSNTNLWFWIASIAVFAFFFIVQAFAVGMEIKFTAGPGGISIETDKEDKPQ